MAESCAPRLPSAQRCGGKFRALWENALVEGNFAMAVKKCHPSAEAAHAKSASKRRRAQCRRLGEPATGKAPAAKPAKRQKRPSRPRAETGAYSSNACRRLKAAQLKKRAKRSACRAKKSEICARPEPAASQDAALRGAPPPCKASLACRQGTVTTPQRRSDLGEAACAPGATRERSMRAYRSILSPTARGRRIAGECLRTPAQHALAVLYLVATSSTRSVAHCAATGGVARGVVAESSPSPRADPASRVPATMTAASALHDARSPACRDPWAEHVGADGSPTRQARREFERRPWPPLAELIGEHAHRGLRCSTKPSRGRAAARFRSAGHRDKTRIAAAASFTAIRAARGDGGRAWRRRVICGHSHYGNLRRIGAVSNSTTVNGSEHCPALGKKQRRMRLLHWSDCPSELASYERGRACPCGARRVRGCRRTRGARGRAPRAGLQKRNVIVGRMYARLTLRGFARACHERFPCFLFWHCL